MVLVGDSPYGPEEVSTALGIEVVGVIGWDPRAAGVLTAGVTDRDLRRSLLVRSAASVADSVAARLPGSLIDRPGRAVIGRLEAGVEA